MPAGVPRGAGDGGGSAPFICPECRQPLGLASAGSQRQRFVIPLLILGGIILLVVMGAAAVYMQAKRLKQEKASGQTGTSFEQAQVAAARGEFPLSARNHETAWLDAAVSPAPAPAPEDAPSSEGYAPQTAGESGVQAKMPDLDLEKDENQKVKAEVLKRIDLMPTISSDNKDKLYMSVDRARQMGQIMTIPFGSGRTSLGPGDIDKLKAEMVSPALQKLVQDPTCVFVILGFADSKGDEKSNLRLSQQRAQSVEAALRDKCGIASVLHSVGMGGSTMLGGTRTPSATGWRRSGPCFPGIPAMDASDAGPAASPAAEPATAYLAVIDGLAPQVFPLSPGRFIIGRALEADFRLDHYEVSRRHCEIAWDGAACSVEDLQSQWGTRLRNQPFTARTVLQPGDILTLGGVLLLFRTGAAPGPEELRGLAGAGEAASGPLPVVCRGKTTLCIPLEDHLSLGRDPGSDVVLNTPGGLPPPCGDRPHAGGLSRHRSGEHRGILCERPALRPARPRHRRPAAAGAVPFPLRRPGAAQRDPGFRGEHPCARHPPRGERAHAARRHFPRCSARRGLPGSSGRAARGNPRCWPC